MERQRYRERGNSLRTGIQDRRSRDWQQLAIEAKREEAEEAAADLAARFE